MKRDDLASAIAGYGAGLAAELSLLERLGALAEAQQDAGRGDDLQRLTSVGDERAAVLASLVEVEHQIKPLRQVLSSALEEARAMPGFDEVVALHRAAGQLVSGILSADRGTMESLREAERTRRLAAQTVERGATTLAAYRRVVAPPTRSAIVDAKG